MAATAAHHQHGCRRDEAIHGKRKQPRSDRAGPSYVQLLTPSRCEWVITVACRSAPLGDHHRRDRLVTGEQPGGVVRGDPHTPGRGTPRGSASTASTSARPPCPPAGVAGSSKSRTSTPRHPAASPSTPAGASTRKTFVSPSSAPSGKRTRTSSRHSCARRSSTARPSSPGSAA